MAGKATMYVARVSYSSKNYRSNTIKEREKKQITSVKLYL